MLRLILFSLLLLGCHFSSGFEKDQNNITERPRVLISSDIGGGDPDDFQSMVHFLVYADLFDIEGLISSPPHGGRKSSIITVLEHYKADFNNLKTYAKYPTHADLAAVTKQGAIEDGAPGPGKSTEGSNWIIAAANKDKVRPLYILVWGSSTDIAQALFNEPQIKPRIRVIYIGSWNTKNGLESREYIYNNHPDLWFIENDFTFRGMYEGGYQNGDLDNYYFVTKHVKGHGALGDFYYSQKPDIKMGDTPTVLYLLSPLVGGVGNLDDPTSESWGGMFRLTGHGKNYWTDINDNRKEDAKSVNKWRTQYLRDWQKRMDRCSQKNMAGEG